MRSTTAIARFFSARFTANRYLLAVVAVLCLLLLSAPSYGQRRKAPKEPKPGDNRLFTYGPFSGLNPRVANRKPGKGEKSRVFNRKKYRQRRHGGYKPKPGDNRLFTYGPFSGLNPRVPNRKPGKGERIRPSSRRRYRTTMKSRPPKVRQFSDLVRYSPKGPKARKVNTRYGKSPAPRRRKVRPQQPIPPKVYASPGVGWKGSLRASKRLRKTPKPYGTDYQGDISAWRAGVKNPKPAGSTWPGNIRGKGGQRIGPTPGSSYGGRMRARVDSRSKVAAIVYVLRGLAVGFDQGSKGHQTKTDKLHHVYDGDFKAFKPKRGHPSNRYSARRKYPTRGLQEKRRKLNIFLVRLFNFDQPKEKKVAKARYDKGERNIWEPDSRNNKLEEAEPEIIDDAEADEAELTGDDEDDGNDDDGYNR